MVFLVASEVLVAHQQNQQLLPATVTRAYSSSRPEMIKPILEPIAKMIDSFDPQVLYILC
jgi:hypothetical protein